MTICSLSLPTFAYAIPEPALARWAAQRLRRETRDDGSVLCFFTCSGSTCTNRPLEVMMTVTLDGNGRVRTAAARPVTGDNCNLMCAAGGDAERFFRDAGTCDEAIGLTLEEAASRDWSVEPSGCFCTAGNRRHKWRNVFAALHYAVNHVDRAAEPVMI